MKTIVVDEIEVPVDVMVEVATILSENNLTNEIKGSNDDENTIMVEIHYDRKDKEEREALSEIQDVIDGYNGYDNQEGEEED
jgi:trehalose-6-phosphatase